MWISACHVWTNKWACVFKSLPSFKLHLYTVIQCGGERVRFFKSWFTVPINCCLYQLSWFISPINCWFYLRCIELPSGELTVCNGKIHHFSWENPLFLWPFSIAFCMFTRPGNSWRFISHHGHHWGTSFSFTGRDAEKWCRKMMPKNDAEKWCLRGIFKIRNESTDVMKNDENGWKRHNKTYWITHTYKNITYIYIIIILQYTWDILRYSMPQLHCWARCAKGSLGPDRAGNDSLSGGVTLVNQ